MKLKQKNTLWIEWVDPLINHKSALTKNQYLYDNFLAICTEDVKCFIKQQLIKLDLHS